MLPPSAQRSKDHLSRVPALSTISLAPDSTIRATRLRDILREVGDSWPLPSICWPHCLIPGRQSPFLRSLWCFPVKLEEVLHFILSEDFIYQYLSRDSLIVQKTNTKHMAETETGRRRLSGRKEGKLVGDKINFGPIQSFVRGWQYN